MAFRGENPTRQASSKAFKHAFRENGLSRFSRGPPRPGREHQSRAAGTKVHGAPGARAGGPRISCVVLCKKRAKNGVALARPAGRDEGEPCECCCYVCTGRVWRAVCEPRPLLGRVKHMSGERGRKRERAGALGGTRRLPQRDSQRLCPRLVFVARAGAGTRAGAPRARPRPLVVPGRQVRLVAASIGAHLRLVTCACLRPSLSPS